MKAIKHITGKLLTLLFSHDGSLSSAKLGKQTITHELRFLRGDDYKESLECFGYKEDWDTRELKIFEQLEKQLREKHFTIITAIVVREDLYDVLIGCADQSLSVHIPTKAVLAFDIDKRTFTSVVKLFDSHYQEICEALVHEGG